MMTETMELERQLNDDKEGLRTSLHSLGNRASEAVNWRHQVRSHPWQAIGAATALGVLIGAMIPREHAGNGQPRSSAPRAQIDDRHRNDSLTESTIAPEWARLKAGLAGMVTDRAMVMTQDLLENIIKKRQD